jgi:hypothetical protein
MSRHTLKSLASLAFVSALASPVAVAQDPAPPVAAQAEQQLFTVEELDNLLARVALYPDPILAQLLVAATYPDQVALAARYVRTYGQSGIDDQAWDVSVKAIAHYPPVLNLLDEDPDWATAVGQAYAQQEGDVMASVQGLRRMAHAQGNLVSTAEQTVEVEPQHIRIIPAQPKVIYVPVYDPMVVYYRPVYYARAPSSYWSFGIGFPIGVWLTYDFDWGHRVIYYHGWNGYGRHYTWYHASRPFIYINTIYVNPWRTVVVVNRRVVHRYVDYRRFDRYNWVHRRVSWDRRVQPRPPVERTTVARTARPRDDAGDRVPPTRGEVNRAAPTRGEANRAAPTRTETNRITPTRVGSSNRPYYPGTSQPTRETRPAERPNGNGTWNARPTQERPSPDRATTARPTNDRVTTARRTWSSVPRFAPEETRRTTPPTREATVARQTRPSAPSAAPRSAPSRTSVPRASTPRESAPRASAPSRASTPRASAPSRASTPRASAPSRGSSSGSRSADRSAGKRGD